MCANNNVNVSVFVCVFPPCLERLVAASPCLVHWGAAICSFRGEKGHWHHVQFMTWLILSATTSSKLQAVHTTYQKRAITLNTSWTVGLPSSITVWCFYTVCRQVLSLSHTHTFGWTLYGDFLVQVRVKRIICQSQELTESISDAYEKLCVGVTDTDPFSSQNKSVNTKMMKSKNS